MTDDRGGLYLVHPCPNCGACDLWVSYDNKIFCDNCMTEILEIPTSLLPFL